MRTPELLRKAIVLLTLAGTIATAEEPVLRLCADQWMPYNGEPEDNRPGYVIELSRLIFEPAGIKVEYEILPWEEALTAVREGRKSGAIGANKEEGEGLVLPTEPIGMPQVCMMTLADSTWTYDNLASFRNARLGVIKDYSYWPTLDALIAKKAGSGIVVVGGDDPLEDLMNKLQAREVDVIAESEPVLLWHLRENELDRSLFRVVYKHQPDPIFVAFAPSDEGRRFAAIFDRGMRSLRASGELTTLLRRYGLSDWKDAK